MSSLLPLLLKTKPKQDPSKPHGKKKIWQLDFIVIRAKKKDWCGLKNTTKCKKPRTDWKAI